ncbi:hypothetical protein E8E12_009238 [Didymella heteroderae]|uniref:Uncharacterized protein n=1 Tax=Didymella heteroderae TaxID=1769908 RepID=A0A9P5C1A6_9PLEO|nr:hypothetical protein E8E12_009238 [Didymella heteroderae]
MQPSRFLFGLSALLLPVALLGTTWLYLYPLFHGCAFPTPNESSLPLLDSRAPFRLLALGDPQLEGDSSLPDPSAPVFPSLQDVGEKLREVNFDVPDVLDIVRDAARGAVRDLGVWLEGYRKMVDLWGNDWYLAHIVRSLRWWTEPTHVAVLGDLLGSQWITDGEFDKRAGRYWGTVMRGLERVPDHVTGKSEEVESDHYDEPEYVREKTWGGRREVLGQDKRWEKRVINIAGNHDIGYAGDIDEKRVERFERAFGSVNWDIWFELPSASSGDNTTTDATLDRDTSTADPQADGPALRLVILNTMNLDTPAYTESLQQDTYAFMNHIITTSRPVTSKTHATILLTHIPLHKEPGICVDSPYFDYFDGGHGVREQNMLSPYGSKVVLESIFGLNRDVNAEGKGMGRRGVVVNGHDHEGCDTLHWIRQPGAPTCDAGDVDKGDAYWQEDNGRNDTAAESAMPTGLDGEAEGAANHTTDTASDATESSDSSPGSPEEVDSWRAVRFPPRQYDVKSDQTCTHIPSSPHLREITLRSMMGDFSGHAGFLSAWFDHERGEEGEWVLEFSSCGVGVQHWWWGVHIVDLILVVALLAGAIARVAENVPPFSHGKQDSDRMEKRAVEKAEASKADKFVKGSETVVEMAVEPGARSLGEMRRV